MCFHSQCRRMKFYELCSARLKLVMESTSHDPLRLESLGYPVREARMENWKHSMIPVRYRMDIFSAHY